MPFAATWMDPENIIRSEVSQTEKDKYYITYMWNLKNNTNESMYKIQQKQTHRHRKQTWLPKGKRGEDKLGVWD